MSAQYKIEEAEEQSPDTASDWLELDQATIHERVHNDKSNGINQPVCRLSLSLALVRDGKEYYGPWPTIPGAILKLKFNTFQTSIFEYENSNNLRYKTAL